MKAQMLKFVCSSLTSMEMYQRNKSIVFKTLFLLKENLWRTPGPHWTTWTAQTSRTLGLAGTIWHMNSIMSLECLGCVDCVEQGEHSRTGTRPKVLSLPRTRTSWASLNGLADGSGMVLLCKPKRARPDETGIFLANNLFSILPVKFQKKR